MKARLHDLSLARDGGYLLTISTRENVGALYDELHEVDVDVTVKKHREKRSLDANAYSWVLLDKLAEATGTPKSEIYRREVRDVGGNTETVCVREKAVQKPSAIRYLGLLGVAACRLAQHGRLWRARERRARSGYAAETRVSEAI